MAQANCHSGVRPNTRDQFWIEHLRTYHVSAQSGPWLRDRDQCDGGLWLCGARSERKGASANSDFHIRGGSSMARLAGCTLMRWSTIDQVGVGIDRVQPPTPPVAKVAAHPVDAALAAAIDVALAVEPASGPGR